MVWPGRLRKYSVLMVCTANICRSPIAAGLLSQALNKAGIAKQVRVDSAGTHALKGQCPDARGQKVARSMGAELKSMRARQFTQTDFEIHDLILCMDRKHHSALVEKCPQEHRHKISLILDFATGLEVDEVPDPYYGNVAGFERVAGLLKVAAEGVTQRVRADLDR